MATGKHQEGPQSDTTRYHFTLAFKQAFLGVSLVP